MGVLYHEYRVIVAGQDVTSRFDPLLTSIKITRASGEAADECSLDISDPDGNVVLPSERADVLIEVDGQRAFKGFVSDVSYDIDKSAGRRMSISASSIDQGSKVKEPKLKQKDDATLEEVAKEWGKAAGLNVTVGGSITSIKRAYWIQQHESFMGWAQRIASEVGASIKIIGNEAYMIAINEGISASGKPLPTIDAAYGVNLLSASITPIMSRPKFKNVEVSYFDRASAQKKTVNVPSGIEDVDAALRTVITAADEDEAKQMAGAAGKRSDREKGAGSINILGAIYAEPEALVNLTGVRPGIDGQYRIASISHTISKGSGFVTSIELRQPQGGAGKDDR